MGGRKDASCNTASRTAKLRAHFASFIPNEDVNETDFSTDPCSDNAVETIIYVFGEFLSAPAPPTRSTMIEMLPRTAYLATEAVGLTVKEEVHSGEVSRGYVFCCHNELVSR